ncbi:MULTISPECIES: hypothetical protein [unclassified Streptomyces]|uniref:hypothetical protein n=1 Tax=unclassified Streptomyces TaxID=2593676 RepID=UPI0036E56D21
MAFEQITPEQFRDSVAPLIGEGPTVDVAGAYAAMSALPDRSITPENSAQRLLGITPRTTGQWLTDIGLRPQPPSASGEFVRHGLGKPRRGIKQEPAGQPTAQGVGEGWPAGFGRRSAVVTQRGCGEVTGCAPAVVQARV